MSKKFILIGLFLLVSCTKKDDAPVSVTASRSVFRTDGFGPSSEGGCSSFRSGSLIREIEPLGRYGIDVFTQLPDRKVVKREENGVLLKFDSGLSFLMKVASERNAWPTDSEIQQTIDYLLQISASGAQIKIRCQPSTDYSESGDPSKLMHMQRYMSSGHPKEGDKSDAAGIIWIESFQL